MKSNQLHQGVIVISQRSETQRASAERDGGDVTDWVRITDTHTHTKHEDGSKVSKMIDRKS